MMRGVIIQSVVALASIFPLALAARPAIPGRLLPKRDFLCPVVCDDTWCCQIGQICQAASGGDVPFECADPLFETTDSAFALSPLLTAVESIIEDNSAFISSLTAALSLTLTFPTVTVLPDHSEETTTSVRPSVTEPSVASSTAAPETTNTREDEPTSSSAATETSSSTATSDAASSRVEPSSSPEPSGSDSTATTSSRGSTSRSTTSFDPVPTSAVPAAAPKFLSPWQLGSAAIGLVMAVLW